MVKLAPFQLWHLIPKWLLALTASLEVPHPDSNIPCANLILAGIPVRSISSMAMFLYFLMNALRLSVEAPHMLTHIKLKNKIT